MAEGSSKYMNIIEAVIFLVVSAFVIAAILGSALNTLGNTTPLSTAGASVVAIYGLMGIIIIIVIILLFLKLAR